MLVGCEAEEDGSGLVDGSGVAFLNSAEVTKVTKVTFVEVGFCVPVL